MNPPPAAPSAAPSEWVQRWAPLIRPGGSVLDVACGSGRQTLWLQAQGFAVTGVDRDATALQSLHALDGRIETIVADIETQTWPLAGRQFDAVVVTNYLWRPLAPALRAALAAGGVYLHETFADGQQHLGRPRRAEFLLQPGELLSLAAGLHIVAYEDVRLESPARCVQRIAACSQAPARGS